jgi:hypothetical protein
MDVIVVPPPGVEHFDIVVGGLIAGMARRWGVPARSMPELPRRARMVLREGFARHRSLRQLRRNLEDVLAVLVSEARRDAN